MKKILVSVLAVMMLVGGCAFLQTAQEILCNPPQSVIDVANAAAPIVAVAITMALPGSAAYVNAVSVQAVITAIQGGACVTLTQVNNLIAFIQSEQAQSIATKAMLKAGPMRAVALDATPLIEWRDAAVK